MKFQLTKKLINMKNSTTELFNTANSNAILSVVHPLNVKPQHRNFPSKILFKNNRTGEEQILNEAYSYPADRCEGCFFYRIENETTPIGHYCRIGIFSNLVKNSIIEEGKTPKECQVFF